MRFFCRENHWLIIQGQLILKTPTGRDKERSRKMIKTLEAEIRMRIYDEICALQLTENRKAITKAGIDNVALTIQSLCAEVALGKNK